MAKSTALVVGVGAEQGLGAALCRRFAAGGYHVLVAGRTQAKIDQVAKTINDSGGSAEAIATDATDEASIIKTVRSRDVAGRRPRSGRSRRLECGEQPEDRFPRTHRSTVRGFLAGRLFQRLSGRSRSRAPPCPARPRYDHLHRRLREHSRQAGLRAFLRRQSRFAHDLAKHGARIRAARHSCRACGG